MFLNKLLTDRFHGYTWKSLYQDLLSGFVIAIIAIPLGIAFAIASGVKPEYGLYTTIIAGILISLLGGSRFQIGGPAGAFIPVVLGIVMTYGYENLLIAGFLSGVILLIMGIIGIGSLIKFIPKPVTIGFTAGIAVIIFVGQSPNFFGINGLTQHESFHLNVWEIIQHFEFHSYSVFTAMICLFFMIITTKLLPKVPGSLVGLLGSTMIASIFYPEQVVTIGSAFGGIPNQLPEFSIPDITWDKLITLLSPAFVIAMLGGIESLLSAVVADEMTRTRHNSNRELIGQGIANMVTPLFGGIPATGAIARTATNIRNGAVSPLAGIFHGLFVLVILLLFAPYGSMIPLSGIAPILMMVAWNMSERKQFLHILRTKTTDSLVLITTFLLTVFVNLTTAVEIGLLLSILLFIRGMTRAKIATDSVAKTPLTFKAKNPTLNPESLQIDFLQNQIRIYRVEGPLFFGIAQEFEQSIQSIIRQQPKVLILRMGRVPLVDLTAESYLSRVIKDFSRHGIVLVSEMKEEPLQVVKKTGLFAFLGEDRFFSNLPECVEYAMQLVHSEWERERHTYNELEDAL